jgi:hypothetical protein
MGSLACDPFCGFFRSHMPPHISKGEPDFNQIGDTWIEMDISNIPAEVNLLLKHKHVFTLLV